MCGFMNNNIKVFKVDVENECVVCLIVEILVKLLFLNGFIVYEFYLLIYGVCKGFIDIVFNIVKLGYLIRRLVDVV